MARGKHAAAASKRRAESAEQQLDRLLPKLVEAQRIARMYRSEAEQTPVLRRHLAERREAEGVPVDQHLAELRSVESERDEILAAYDEALDTLFSKLVAAGLIRDAQEAPHIDDRLLDAIYVLPEAPIQQLLKALGWFRGLRRVATEASTAERIRDSLRGKKMQGGQLLEFSSDSPIVREYAQWKSELHDKAAVAS